MTVANHPASLAGDREIVAARILDAPRELVFKMWTDPQRIGQWWGPNGFTTTTFSMDVKPGGVWRFIMHGPDGVDYQNKITYVEVFEPERIVYKHGGDKDCEPVNFQATVTFEPQGNRTRLTWQMLFPSAAERDHVVSKYGAIEGLSQTIGRLEDHLAKMPVVIQRSFDVPADVVWKAITDRDQMRQWFFDTMDSFKAEPGFRTQFNVRCGDKDYLHLWRVIEVVPGKSISVDWKYGGYSGDSLVTFQLSPENGLTSLTVTHAGLENFPRDNPDFSRESCTEGWTFLIGKRLREFMERTRVAHRAGRDGST